MYNITVLKGDGVGPEIINEAVKVLNITAQKFGHNFKFTEALIGGAAIDECGVPLPEETIKACLKSNAVLLGAVGGAKWDKLPAELRPESGLLGIRKKLKLFANLRPASTYKALAGFCPIKNENLGSGFDIMVVRELTGDVYFGRKGRNKSGNKGFDIMNYSTKEVERIGRLAFEMARLRGKKLCSVDKANVLETSRVWRETMHRLKDEYRDVLYSDMYVDNCAMQLIKDPSQFDVIVTGNLFGDILSDEASMLTGSIGMLPSASLGKGTLGLYEPIHGSAPDIAGKGIANPIATILSAALMLRYSLKLFDEAAAIERAVSEVLDDGYRTADIAKNGEKAIKTSEMGELIANKLKALK